MSKKWPIGLWLIHLKAVKLEKLPHLTICQRSICLIEFDRPCCIFIFFKVTPSKAKCSETQLRVIINGICNWLHELVCRGAPHKQWGYEARINQTNKSTSTSRTTPNVHEIMRCISFPFMLNTETSYMLWFQISPYYSILRTKIQSWWAQRWLDTSEIKQTWLEFLKSLEHSCLYQFSRPNLKGQSEEIYCTPVWRMRKMVSSAPFASRWSLPVSGCRITTDIRLRSEVNSSTLRTSNSIILPR